ncbi:hypothetical protein BDV12DRAFT_196016 [Aspergillus spectabilis]
MSLALPPATLCGTTSTPTASTAHADLGLIIQRRNYWKRELGNNLRVTTGSVASNPISASPHVVSKRNLKEPAVQPPLSAPHECGAERPALNGSASTRDSRLYEVDNC